MLAPLGSFVLGTILMLLGADSLARGSSGLALRAGLGGYAVGLAATAFGAIVPAFAILVAALMAGRPELALGSLVGGSIAQLALVLGLCALAAPVRARLKLFVWASPGLIAASILIWLLSLDARLGAVDGAILIVGYLGVAVLVIRAARGENERVRNEIAEATGTSMLVWRDAARVVVGLVVLPFAAAWMVEGALAFAESWAISPLVIGLTVLGGAAALASVLPTVQAARRDEGDFAIGHAFAAVLGSVLLLAGALALAEPLGVARSLQRIEIPALIALAVAVYPMMKSDGELSRREGAILVAAYVLFLLGEAWLAVR